jgi:hypothetical protein
MSGSVDPILFITVLTGVAALVAGAVAYRSRTIGSVSRRGVAVAALPALLMLSLHCSLAIHMYQSLGGWPASIGEEGFPAALVIHADVADYCFIAVVLVCLFVWPAVFLLCVAVRRWRKLTAYLAVFAFSCGAGFGLLQLAPQGFLYWWRD